MKPRITELEYQSIKSRCSAQRYFINDFLREKGHHLTKEKYKNWAELAELLGDASRALYELYELRNEAMILAHGMKTENAKLQDRLVALISVPEVLHDDRRT
jgi:hypothetical protein